MKTFGRLISLLILPLIAEIIYSTSKSYFFRDTPIWSFETTLFLYGSFFMLGGAYCLMEKKHVAVEVLAHHLSARQQRILSVFSSAVVLLVSFVIIWCGTPSAWKSTLMGERSTHQTPFNPQIWWYKWIIPISGALLMWQAARDAYGLLTGKGTDSQREENRDVR
jgi:TRAP-type C4-dicarboxylate transport system permease small subunit